MNEEYHSEVITANKIAELRNLCTLTYNTKYIRENQIKGTETCLEDG